MVTNALLSLYVTFIISNPSLCEAKHIEVLVPSHDKSVNMRDTVINRKAQGGVLNYEQPELNANSAQHTHMVGLQNTMI